MMLRLAGVRRPRLFRLADIYVALRICGTIECHRLPDPALNRGLGGSEPCAQNALGMPSRGDLDLSAKGLGREAAVPADAERAL